MTRPIVIWGCGGFAREVAMLCEQMSVPVVGFLDERPELKGRLIDDLPVFGDLADLPYRPADVHVLCAGVGDPALKRKFARRTREAGYEAPAAIVHPAIYLHRTTRVGRGSVVCQGNVLTVNVVIGEHAIINLNCTVGHDTCIEDFVTVSPGANLSGNVTLKTGCYIGTNVGLREKLSVGAWSVVGGGAFVAGDIPDSVLAVGIPAKPVRELARPA